MTTNRVSGFLSDPSVRPWLGALYQGLGAINAGQPEKAISSTFTGLEQAQQQQQKQDVLNNFKANLGNLSPMQKMAAQAVIASGDMGAISKLFEEMGKPVNVASGGMLIDPITKQTVYQNPTSPSSGRFAQGQALEGAIQDVMATNKGFSKEQSVDAIRQYMAGKDTLSDGTPFNISEVGKGYLGSFTLRSDTAQGINQSRFAATTDTIFKDADNLTKGAFSFSGVNGQAKLAKAKLNSQLNPTKIDPDYRDYLLFTRQSIPGLASEIMRTGGANASDTQKVLAIMQANPISYDSNPDLAQQQWNYLKSLYKDIGKTVGSGAVSIRRSLRQNDQNQNSLSEDDIQYNMKKYNKTHQEVLDEAKLQGY